MKRSDRIKLNFTRNWRLPGRERLSNWFKPSDQLKAGLQNGIVWLMDEDIAIYTTADNYIEWTILSTGTYEDEISKLIRLSLKEGGVALDIGANIGLPSIRRSQCAGAAGQVYSFEPLNFLQKKFRKNITLNKADNVKLFPFALSDQESEAEFSVDSKIWNQGAFNIGEKGSGSETQSVSIKVADNIPEIKDLTRLDLVKIDVEGFEYPVLTGLKQTLEKFRPRIIFEYEDNYWQAKGHSINDCLAFLRSMNYTIYQVTPVGCELVTKAEEISTDNLFCIQE